MTVIVLPVSVRERRGSAENLSWFAYRRNAIGIFFFQPDNTTASPIAFEVDQRRQDSATKRFPVYGDWKSSWLEKRKSCSERVAEKRWETRRWNGRKTQSEGKTWARDEIESKLRFAKRETVHVLRWHHIYLAPQRCTRGLRQISHIGLGSCGAARRRATRVIETYQRPGVTLFPLSPWMQDARFS